MSNTTISFDLFGSTLTTRSLGKEVREKIELLISSGHRIQIDLSKIELMTSGFTDEVFGILFENLGMSEFQKNLSFNFPKEDEKKKLLLALISRAINDRMNRTAVK